MSWSTALLATDVLAWSSALLALFGVVQALGGWIAVRAHVARARPAAPAAGALPGITLLKPLYGDEPLLEEALASFCTQDYPRMQLVFGLQDPADPALHVLRRLRDRFPAIDMTIVVDPTQHGVNRKVGNLINMLPAAKHDVLVVSDSDIHAPRDYLRGVVAALAAPGVGLVTTLYGARRSNGSLVGRLGATQIAHGFLPGALMGRALGRQDCLGATMAIRRDVLERAGGFRAIVHDIADDAVLGRRVNALGLGIGVADVVPLTTVPEQALGDLTAHELRWARTIRSLAPFPYLLSAVQFPLFWAALAIALSGAAPWSIGLCLLAWAARAAAIRGIDRSLRLPRVAPAWLLPLRDLLSAWVMIASYAPAPVRWRGEVVRVARPRLVPGKG